MFSYKKVEIEQVLKIAPNEAYRNVLVVGETFDDLDEFEIDNHYFLIEDVIVYDNKGAHHYSGYMKAYFPSHIIDEMYLYLVKSTIDNYEMFFIDPVIYENTPDLELEMLLLETIDNIELKNETNLLNNLYENNMLFYQLKGKSKKQHGPIYLTRDLIGLIEKDEETFHKNIIYEIHHEPIIYNLNNGELLFIGNNDFAATTIRLLKIDKKGFLLEKKRMLVDDAIDYFEKENYSVHNIMKVYNVLKEFRFLSNII